MNDPGYLGETELLPLSRVRVDYTWNLKNSLGILLLLSLFKSKLMVTVLCPSPSPAKKKTGRTTQPAIRIATGLLREQGIWNGIGRRKL